MDDSGKTVRELEAECDRRWSLVVHMILMSPGSEETKKARESYMALYRRYYDAMQRQEGDRIDDHSKLYRVIRTEYGDPNPDSEVVISCLYCGFDRREALAEFYASEICDHAPGEFSRGVETKFQVLEVGPDGPPGKDEWDERE